MLEIKNIIKKYKPKKGVQVVALDNVSLKLQDKGMVFILGKSGSGKSTLLNVLGGLDKFDSGEIIIKGKSSKAFSQSDFDSYRNTYVGFIFQEYNILDEFTVGANIALAMELQGKKATNEIINEIMDEVDLSGYGSRKPNELSGGQMQRVAIARALVKNPEIIMADEPTGALDSKTGIQVFETLKKLSKTKLVLVVSHDREFAEQYGDRVIEFSDGKIISDIEKHVARANSQSEGVNILDDSIIYIKKGYKLSLNDLELINQYLEKSTNDVFISSDKDTNNHIKKIAKIDEDGNREVFRPSDNKAIENIINEENKFKLIKSKLPFKDSLKIGASGLKGKPFRLFFTIFLSMISFALFGLADTMGSYDKINATVTSIVDSNINNISFIKRIEIKDSEYSYYNDASMNDADIQILKDKLDLDFKPVYSGTNNYGEQIPINYNVYDNSKLGDSWNGFYRQSLSGFGEFTTSDINNLGFKIVGEMPKNNNEIAISEYIYEHFKTGGYKNDEIEIKPENINLETDLIGNNLFINNKNYKITAIIDTELDPSRYESLKSEFKDGGFGDYIMMQEFNTVINYGYHGLIFVQPGFINSLMEANESKGVNIESIGWVNLFTNDIHLDRVQKLLKSSDIDANTVMFDEGKDTLSEGEVILNAQELINRINIDEIVVKQEDVPDGLTPDIYSFSQYLSEAIYKAISDYAINNYDEAGMIDAPEYNNYLWGEGYSKNEYGMSGFDIEWTVKKDIFERYDLLNKPNEQYKMTSIIYNNPIDADKEKFIDVVGYYIPDSSLLQNCLVVDDGFYNMYAEYTPGPYIYAIGNMPTSNQGIKKVVEFSEGSSIEGVKYSLKNEVSYILNEVNQFIEPMAKGFLYIGIGFAVFSALLLFSFITSSITIKKREIGILRALGSRSNDVFGIFLNESLIIAVINFILAFVLSFGVVIYINNYLRGEYRLLITFLNFGIRQILLMLFVSVAVAFVASFIPVYRISHKKPIDAIRNR